MKSILKFFGCLLLMSVFAFQQHVMAQNAEDYFHDGAQNYISGSLESAIARVQEGLSQYPNDPKLNELLTKLEEEQEQQQNQQQEQQNQDQENQNQDQQNQEQENQEEQEQQENEQNEENQEQNPDEQLAQPKDAREISKEEAQKILQALAQKEKELLKEFKKQKKQGSATHDKDW